MHDFEWKNPPEQLQSDLDIVIEMLKSRPNEWALIDKSNGIKIMPWWGRIHSNSDFELRFVYANPDNHFGAKEVYARFVGGEVSEEN